MCRWIKSFLKFANSGKNIMVSDNLPCFVSGTVVKGFGRGSKELGTPTANYSSEVVKEVSTSLDTGIYFGWAKVDDGPVYKMVMSCGWNPFYKNTEKTLEVHILHEFEQDFYGSIMKICILDYIRPEMNFSSVDELIEQIKSDIAIAKKELDKQENTSYQNHDFFRSSSIKS